MNRGSSLSGTRASFSFGSGASGLDPEIGPGHASLHMPSICIPASWPSTVNDGCRQCTPADSGLVGSRRAGMRMDERPACGGITEGTCASHRPMPWDDQPGVASVVPRGPVLPPGRAPTVRPRGSPVLCKVEGREGRGRPGFCMAHDSLSCKRTRFDRVREQGDLLGLGIPTPVGDPGRGLRMLTRRDPCPAHRRKSGATQAREGMEWGAAVGIVHGRRGHRRSRTGGNSLHETEQREHNGGSEECCEGRKDR